MTIREHVEEMLANEERILDRQKGEVTYDRTRETAQTRKDCLDQVLRLFEPKPLEAA